MKRTQGKRRGHRGGEEDTEQEKRTQGRRRGHRTGEEDQVKDKRTQGRIHRGEEDTWGRQ